MEINNIQYKSFKRRWVKLLGQLKMSCACEKEELKEIKTEYITQYDIIERFLNAEPSSDKNLAEEIIKEKTRFRKSSLVQVLTLIINRQKAKEDNIASIDSKIIDFQSQLYLYKCHIYPINPDNKRKSNLEKAISDLENRRRQEDVECWKDTVKMWQQLLDIAAEYRAAVRKAKILLPDN